VDNDRSQLIKHIGNLVVDFNFGDIRKKRQERYLNSSIYEGVHTLDLNQFSDSGSMLHAYEMSKMSVGSLENLFNSGQVRAKTRIFEERYSGGVLDMNIFCFTFINENELTNASGSLVNTLQSQAAGIR